MLHTYKTTPGDLAGYGGPKGIMGVGVILLVSLTSAMEGILRMQQMVVLRSSFWKILVRIQPRDIHIHDLPSLGRVRSWRRAAVRAAHLCRAIVAEPACGDVVAQQTHHLLARVGQSPMRQRCRP